MIKNYTDYYLTHHRPNLKNKPKNRYYVLPDEDRKACFEGKTLIRNPKKYQRFCFAN